MQVVEVSQIELKRDTGMGRVACEWATAFSARGHDFIHVGPDELGRVHPYLFPRRAWEWIRARRMSPDMFLIHEPAGLPFVKSAVRTIVFSHGLERRGWEISRRWAEVSGERTKLRSRFVNPILRLRACDASIRMARHVFVLNQEDRTFCEQRYQKPAGSVTVIRNGIDQPTPCDSLESETPTVLFVGSWLPRKGIRILAGAAERLRERGADIRWLLAGTGAPRDEVLAGWPLKLHPATEVVPHFNRSAEASIFSAASIFALPSFFEGQPLSLLQAMSSGLCCVTTDTCGQKDLIRHGENGLLVNCGDAEGLAAALHRVILDSGLRAALGRSARTSVAGRSWRETSREMVEIVESVRRGPGEE